MEQWFLIRCSFHLYQNAVYSDNSTHLIFSGKYSFIVSIRGSFSLASREPQRKSDYRWEQRERDLTFLLPRKCYWHLWTSPSAETETCTKSFLPSLMYINENEKLTTTHLSLKLSTVNLIWPCHAQSALINSDAAPLLLCFIDSAVSAWWMNLGLLINQIRRRRAGEPLSWFCRDLTSDVHINGATLSWPTITECNKTFTGMTYSINQTSQIKWGHLYKLCEIMLSTHHSAQ